MCDIEFNVKNTSIISTLFFIQDCSVCYRDLLKNAPPIRLDLEELSSGTGPDSCKHLEMVEDLIQLSMGELQRVYHLVGLINKKFPDRARNWFNELFRAEQRDRLNRFKMKYYISVGEAKKSEKKATKVIHDGFDSAYATYVEHHETDELLLQKVTEGLRHWVFC